MNDATMMVTYAGIESAMISMHLLIMIVINGGGIAY